MNMSCAKRYLLCVRMDGMDREKEVDQASSEDRKRDLYLRQKQLLDTFLGNGAISRAQYEKSLGDLTRKMGYEEDRG